MPSILTYSILFERIWSKTECAVYILLLPLKTTSCDVKFKLPTVQNASSSLLSHLPPPPMQLLTWFFLLWPLATLYYHLGPSDHLLHHLGSHKSSTTAITSIKQPYLHCGSILSIILYNFC